MTILSINGITFAIAKEKYFYMFILLVDNNRFFVDVLQTMLLKAGFNYIACSENGFECIAQVKKHENPDVIIIATMGGFGVEEQNIWKSYAGLKAAKNNKVFLIDSETSCSPTPASFVKAFTDVVKFVNQ